MHARINKFLMNILLNRSRRGERWGVEYGSNPCPNIHAISLILLAQPHSAAMERVFSQLTYIWRVTNRQGLEDQAYLRCMLRCCATIINCIH